MVAAGDHDHLSLGHLVDEAMGAVDPSGPISLQIEFQRLRFTYPFEWMEKNIVAKRVDPRDVLRISPLPI